MKANEAPEKLYILPDGRNPNGLSYCWYEAPYCTGAIEYTRTDAFIEKALKFIKTNVDRIVNNQHSVCMGYMDEEFKKYMEGE